MTRDYEAEYRRRVERGAAAGLTRSEAAGHRSSAGVASQGAAGDVADAARPSVAPAGSYADFLAAKRARAPHDGIALDPDDLHPSLFPHQREVVRWAAERARAGVFLNTGLGKSRVAASWLSEVTGDGCGLIVCPLSIARRSDRLWTGSEGRTWR